MADDHSQRPYRSSESIARAGQAKPSASASDPLAELARLIGQSDPFGEFSRENARRSGGVQPRAEEPAYAAAPSVHPHNHAENYEQAYAQQGYPAQAEPDYPQQSYAQSYQKSYAQPAFAEPAYGQQAYAQQGYGAADQGPTTGYEPDQYPANPPYNAQEQDFYDDVPPSRRRMGVLVIAGVFALAILGTAGAFGYRAIFGSSASNVPPPVIKADTAPSKIVPATAKDAQSNKLITDRVTGPQGEKLVSREETPVGRPPLSPDNAAGNSGGGAQQAALGSGVVVGEPKKIRTIAIHPDQNALADGPSGSSPAPAASQPPRTASAPPPEPPVRQVQTRPVEASPPVAPPAPAAVNNNAPLSLNPNAQAAQPARASAPARTASVEPTQAAPGGGTTAYAVQVTSQRSEAEAQAAFRSLQAKYAAQLAGKQSFIYRVDLGAKGTYYRAMVGPYVSQNEAGEVCASLKAAGGQCIVQKN